MVRQMLSTWGFSLKNPMKSHTSSAPRFVAFASEVAPPLDVAASAPESSRSERRVASASSEDDDDEDVEESDDVEEDEVVEEGDDIASLSLVAPAAGERCEDDDGEEEVEEEDEKENEDHEDEDDDASLQPTVAGRRSARRRARVAPDAKVVGGANVASADASPAMGSAAAPRAITHDDGVRQREASVVPPNVADFVVAVTPRRRARAAALRTAMSRVTSCDIKRVSAALFSTFHS